MKFLYILFSSFMAMSLFSSCGGNRYLQDDPPAQFQQVYYTEDENGMNVYLPVSVIQENRVSLDSLYFRGMKSELRQDEDQPNLYVANFSTKDPDPTMSGDPTEEYGNRAPQRPEKSPFKIENDEAILVFTQNDTRGYYQITGIEAEGNN